MSSVDTRIVQMQFDNKQFESGIKTSLDSIEQLNKSVKAVDSTKGMAGLSTAVETVQARFSAMQVVAMTALSNITNSAVNAGKRIVSALTIDPVKTGLQEYETQINAVQTILANTESKGTTLDQVNTALDTLNQYADKTIYNFTEMTRNIGTFTAAGVDLDTSVSAIQGIANLAAVSGSTSQQASTAMYQLSQALSSGTVKLMDWNSVTNAGMGGQVFQDAIKETARVYGINIDEMIEKEGSFRETLKNGWFTSEILTETLKKFTYNKEDMTEAQIAETEAMLKAQGYTEAQIEAIFKLGKTSTDAATKVKTFSQLMDTLKEAAQSGWTQTWEIIIGDFEEAKELWSSVYGVIGGFIDATSQARNKQLQAWKDLGGRTQLIEAFKNAFQGVVNIIKPISQAFGDMFPRKTGQQLFDITVGFKGLTESFKKWTENADNIGKITRTFKGLFAILNIGKKLLGAVFNVFKTVLGITGEAAGGFLSVTAVLGDFLVALDNAIEKGNVFGFIAGKISSGFLLIFKGIKAVVVKIGKAFGLFKDVDLSGVDSFVGALKKRFEPIIKIGEAIWKVISTVWSVIKKVASLIGKALSDLGKNISGAIQEGDYNSLMNIIDGVLTTGIGAGLLSIVLKIRKALKEGGDIFENVDEILEGVGKSIKGFYRDLNAKALLKIAIAIAVLTATLIALSFVDVDSMSDGLGVMALVMAGMFAGMALLSRNSKGMLGSIKIVNDMGSTMIGFAVAILSIAGALRMLAGFSWDELWPAMTAIGILTVVLGTFMAIIAKVGQSTTTLNKSGLKIQKSGLAQGALTIIAFAGAILMLVQAIKQLGEIDRWKAIEGMGQVVVLMTSLAAALRLMGKNVKGALTVIAFAGAIWILAKAIKQLGEIDRWKVIEGGMQLSVMMLALAAALRLMGKNVKGALTVIAFAGAIWILANAIKQLAEIDRWKVIEGVQQLAVMMISLAAALRLMGGNVKGVFTVLAFAGAMWILVPAIKKLGEMDIGTLSQGMVALGVAMLAFAGAMRLMPSKDILSRAVAFLAITAAILAITHALETVAAIPLAGLIQAGVALGGMLVLMGVVAVVAKKSIVGAAAIAIIAASLLLVAGAFAIVAALPMESLAVGVVAIVAALAGLAVVAAGLGSFGPVVLAGAGALALIGAAMVLTAASVVIFAAGISALKIAFQSFAELSWGEFGKALAMVSIAVVSLAAVCGLLGVLSPVILIGAAALVVLGAGFLVASAGISAFAASLTALGHIIAFIIGVITNLGENISERFAAWKESMPVDFAEMGKNIVAGLANGIKSAVGLAWDAIKGLGKKILDSFKSMLGIHSPSTKFAEFGKYTVQGFINGFKSKVSNALNAVKDFASKCLTTVKNGLSTFGNSAKNAVSNFVSGFKSKVSNAISTVKTFGSNCVNAIRSKVSSFVSAGRTGISNFVSGAKSKVSSGISTVKSFATNCVNSIKNGISGFATAGKNAVSGFINGIKSKISAAANTAWDVGKKALSSIKNALGIHSPSKEFEEVGRYSNEGFAGGLKKFAGVVGKSAIDVGKTAIESLKTPMSNISDVLSGDIDAEPTIRPVLDLSQVQSGANALGGMFGQQTVALAGVNAGIMDGNTQALADVASQMQKVNDAGNTDIVDAIIGLRGDFNSLSEAVSRMQVVLDSGVLVGEIAPGIDAAFGQMITHKGRGN